MARAITIGRTTAPTGIMAADTPIIAVDLGLGSSSAFRSTVPREIPAGRRAMLARGAVPPRARASRTGNDFCIQAQCQRSLPPRGRMAEHTDSKGLIAFAAGANKAIDHRPLALPRDTGQIIHAVNHAAIDRWKATIDFDMRCCSARRRRPSRQVIEPSCRACSPIEFRPTVEDCSTSAPARTPNQQRRRCGHA